MAAHLDSGLGVPDLHEEVVRPAGDELAVPRENDGPHPVRVARQRALLPPATFILEGGPGEYRSFLACCWYQEGLTEFSGLAEIMSGLLKPDRREHHVQLEGS